MNDILYTNPEDTTPLQTKKNFYSRSFWQKQNKLGLSMVLLLLVTLPLTILAVRSQQSLKQHAASGEYDVVVVGGGTGGVSAAIQAARQGSHVALIEETDWLGGQMTAAGVSMIDEGTIFNSGGSAAIERSSGIYKEFVQKVYARYGESNIHKCLYYKEAICLEPHVGNEILQQMVQEAGNIQVLYNTKITDVERSGTKVTGVFAGPGTLYKGKVIIDATEFGDLLPLAKVAYRVGNTTSEAINADSQIQDITYTAIIKKYDGGVPENLQLTAEPPGYQAARAKFAATVDESATPHSFDNKYGKPRDWVLHNAYRGIPDSSRPNGTQVENYAGAQSITKTGVNLANDYPGSLNPAGLTVRYIEDPAYRTQIICEAKLHTIQFLYYMQHDQGQSNWSVANDEGYENSAYTASHLCDNIPSEFKEIEKRLPLIPYVRESRRIMGQETLTAPLLKQEKAITSKTAYDYAGLKGIVKNTTIAIGGYDFDIHGCKTENCLETSLEHENDEGAPHGAFQVSIGTLIPETVDGLIAAEKNISVSRLANGATRLQPITMLTGQAAGSLAALAAQSGKEVRNVRPYDVQHALVAGSDKNLEFPARLSLFQFSDAKIGYPTDPYAHAVQLVSLYKVMTGYDTATFGITETLTRGQLAIIIARLFPNGEAQYNTGEEAVAWLQQAGIARGSNDYASFNPDSPVTKAAVGLFLSRAFAKTGAMPDPGDDAEAARVSLAQKGITMDCSDSSCLETIMRRGDMADTAEQTLRIILPVLPHSPSPERVFKSYSTPVVATATNSIPVSQYIAPVVQSTPQANTPATNPDPRYNPVGGHDDNTCQQITGWACDPDNYAQPLTIQIFKGDTFLGNAQVTNLDRPDINDPAKGGPFCGNNNFHGFQFTPAQGSIAAGDIISVRAVNIGKGNENTLLWNTRKAATCTTQQVPQTTPLPVTPTVSSVTLSSTSPLRISVAGSNFTNPLYVHVYPQTVSIQIGQTLTISPASTSLFSFVLPEGNTPGTCKNGAACTIYIDVTQNASTTTSTRYRLDIPSH